MGIPQDQVIIYSDNQAAKNLATNPIVSPPSKHITIKKHFIREVVQQGDVVISYLDTERMTADILTRL
jgi:chemotaxis signal transduction protein